MVTKSELYSKDWIGPSPDYTNALIVHHVKLMLDCFQRLLGKPLIEGLGDCDQDNAEKVWNSKRMILCHGIQDDPIFIYGNQAALDTWEITWDKLTTMHSRYTAEAMHRDERARMLSQVGEHDFIADYSGIRISATGKRFRISDAIIWTVRDEQGNKIGQGATFETPEFL